MSKNPAQSNCKYCNVEFNTENKKLSKGLCKKCYNQQWYIKKIGGILKNNSVDLGWCQNCKREWNTEFIKESSKKKYKTKMATKELCKSCYEVKRKKRKTCNKCGTEITRRTMKKICDMCSDSIWSSIKDKKNILRHISAKRAEELRLLLNRYKLGIWTEVDHFRVIDTYLELIADEKGQNLAYESLSGENQIRMMLKDLDSLYSMFKERMKILNNIYKHGERKTNKSN